MDPVRTQILILSDTHGEPLPPCRQPRCRPDLVLHCGDLTHESKLHELRTTLDLLKTLDAPLTLVVAGNHDFTLDEPMFRRKILEAGLAGEPDLVAREYGRYGEARQLFDAARESHNIHLLDEGTHRFTLANGAAVSVYASPFTTSPEADWGFQFGPADGHAFAIEEGTDIVLTHSPPAGMLDRSPEHGMLGIPGLFQAVARARPRLHCFGHVHNGWGAKLAAWREPVSYSTTQLIQHRNQRKQPLSHFTAFDNGRSQALDRLWNVQPLATDNAEQAAAKASRLAQYEANGCVRATSHCSDDSHPLVPGQHTLFVNASIMGGRTMPFQLPWLVEMELPEA
ncbi:MAG: hypothetical protein STHCBS139747_002211 [Sporothrix thermara]